MTTTAAAKAARLTTKADASAADRLSAQHSATQAALLELVSDALAAKIAHDVDAHPLALEALTAFTTTATALAAAITTEQQTIREAEDDHR